MATVRRSNPDGFRILNARLKELDDKQARTGWFSSAVYADGTPIAYVALIHEMGSPVKNIPPRPFMRPTVLRERNNWKEIMLAGSKAILRGTASSYDVMEAVSAKAAGDVRKTISQIWNPPLKEATVKARARRYKSKEITQSLRKPLVDTAKMINSLTNKVEDADTGQ